MTTITGPGELASLIPALLGFEPEDSVVAVVVREHGELGAILRLDERDLVGDRREDPARDLALVAMREGARSAIVLAYTRDESIAIEALATAVAALDETVASVEPWIVVAGRYFCPDCDDPRCCPPGGRPVPPGASVPGPAVRLRRMPGSGRAPAAQRRLAARAARRWEDRAPRDLEAWRTESARRWRAVLRDGVDGPARLGALGAALADVRVRDAVLLMLVPGADEAVEDALRGIDSLALGRALGEGMRPATPPDPGTARRARTLLLDLLAHLPARLCAPPAATLAVIAWWSGGEREAREWCAVALDHDPRYRLALLVLALIDAAGPSR
ncbi:DUF4192 family protein [Demequina iriomotensis]|uniref:DUF4192 family protein n=1 Tax=Demequina iriomotensis TaxID=1536641 RepID=UPI0007806CED|nr:DUF4192 family protein [Demequina iriomotensis]